MRVDDGACDPWCRYGVRWGRRQPECASGFAGGEVLTLVARRVDDAVGGEGTEGGAGGADVAADAAYPRHCLWNCN